MGDPSKYCPIPSRLSGVSNQGCTRYHNTPLEPRRNKAVQQRNADDRFWHLKRPLPQTPAQQASKKQLRELLTRGKSSLIFSLPKHSALALVKC